MAKVIYIKKPVVTIEFKDDQDNMIEVFEFDKSDENFKRIVDIQNKFLLEVGKMSEDTSIDKVLEKTKELINEMLGEGAYDRLYGLAQSWDLLIYYFVQICGAIREDTDNNLIGEMETLLSKYTNE